MLHIEDLYKAQLVLLGKLYQAEGKTPLEAITNLKVEKPVRRSGILSVTRGEETRQKIIGGVNIVKLFGGSKLGREIAIKNISLLFS